MPDIGAEYRIDPGAERHGPAESHRIHPVVGLAAEIVRRCVEIDPILLPRDIAEMVVVERHAAGQRIFFLQGPAVAPVELSADVGVAVLLDQLAQERPVEFGRIHVLQTLGAAPFPMFDQVAEELAAPAYAALEKSEAEIGKTPRHAAQEQRLRHGVAARGEMADMVEGEVGRAVALAVAAAAGMERRGDPEFAAFLPQWVVIVFAVQAELVEALGEPDDVGVGAFGRLERAANAAAEHADSCAELLHDELELLDRLLRRMDWNDGGRGEPVLEPFEEIEGDDVEAVDYGAPGRVVGNAWDAEPGGRVDDAVIEPQLVEPVVEQTRQHRGRAVESVRRLPAPETFHPDVARRALHRGQPERVGDATLRLQKPVGAEIADGLAHSLREYRRVLDPMAIRVDHRMFEV